MISLAGLLQAAASATQFTLTPGAPGPGGPPPGFSTREAFFQLAQFVGWFLAIGSIGFRFGIVRRVRPMSDEAMSILRAENAARLGMLGVILLFLAFVGGPYVNSIVTDKGFVASLPRNLAAFELKMALLTVALLGFALVRAAVPAGWTIAAIAVLITVLQPLYTGRIAGKVNAVHILAASTWLGTLLVLTLIGVRGVIKSDSTGARRAELVADLVNSFSPLALAAATIVAATGVTTAWLHLKRLSALWTTSYGIALLTKLAFVAMVVVLGAWNWCRVRPSLGGEGSEETIRRSATLELIFAALVLIATSVLVTLPSPR